MSDSDRTTDGLLRLLYTSTSNIHGSETERMAEIRDIVADCSADNARFGLTGTLFFIAGEFVQVLEGPTPAVEEAFEAICCDFRHTEVNLVECAPVKDRLFAEWHLAFLNDQVGTETAASEEELSEIRFLVGINASEAARRMRQLLVPVGT